MLSLGLRDSRLYKATCELKAARQYIQRCSSVLMQGQWNATCSALCGKIYRWLLVQACNIKFCHLLHDLEGEIWRRTDVTSPTIHRIRVYYIREQIAFVSGELASRASCLTWVLLALNGLTDFLLDELVIRKWVMAHRRRGPRRFRAPAPGWDRFTGSSSQKFACLDSLYLGQRNFSISNISILIYELQLDF
jgi:hypothetical protein